MTLTEFLDEADRLAWDHDQVSTSAHLFATLLQNSSKAKHRLVRTCLTSLETKVFPHLSNQQHGQPAQARVRSYQRPALQAFLGTTTATLAADELLHTILHAPRQALSLPDAFDGTLKSTLRLLEGHGLDRDFLAARPPEGAIEELGFGRWYDPTKSGLPDLLDREVELPRFQGLLGLAISQKRPFFLSGDKGVGKTHFLKHLLARVLAQGLPPWRVAWFTSADFWRAPAAMGEMLETLFDWLIADESVLPVFDDMDHLVAEAGLHAEFDRKLGVFFRGGRRALVACGTTEGTRGSALLAALRPYRLPSLGRPATRAVLRSYLQDRLGDAPAQREPEEGLDAFTDFLLDTLETRYPGKPWPGQALELVDGVLTQSQVRLFANAAAPAGPTRADVWQHVLLDLGLSPELLGQDKREFYTRLCEQLKQEVFGQDHVIDRVAQVLYARAVAPPRDWPRGRFLFVGPPGTGKTQLGKALARHLGYGQGAFYEFNMGEFTGEGARNRFIGSDPGYRHAMETFTIFDAVRQSAACVILLDEIDRADGSIQDVLLGLLEGRGRDALGTTHRFDQVIFLLTTNQGQEQIEAEYDKLRRAGRPRSEVAQAFDGRTLRQLLISRALSTAEEQIRSFARAQMAALSDDFATAADKVAALQSYAEWKRIWQALAYDNSKSLLDRALLDRVDFIFPFFPLEEPEVRRVLDLHLGREGWPDCPATLRDDMVKEALRERERGRAAIRIVEQYKERDPRFYLFASSSSP